jgi:hypothetical protein
METLFVLLYWPVVGVLILFVSRALLRKGIGPWWNLLLICVPLWALSIGVFFSVKDILHLHGRLLQMVGIVAGPHFENGFYGYLYELWMATWCCYVATEPAFQKIREESRKKKAAKAAQAGGV